MIKVYIRVQVTPHVRFRNYGLDKMCARFKYHTSAPNTWVSAITHDFKP